MVAELIAAFILSVLFIAIGIVMLTGHGAFLIAGLNSISEDEKEKYDSKALCKFIGKILLPIGIVTPVLILRVSWIPFVYAAIVISLVVFAAIYASTRNRFRK